MWLGLGSLGVGLLADEEAGGSAGETFAWLGLGLGVGATACLVRVRVRARVSTLP